MHNATINFAESYFENFIPGNNETTIFLLNMSKPNDTMHELVSNTKLKEEEIGLGLYKLEVIFDDYDRQSDANFYITNQGNLSVKNVTAFEIQRITFKLKDALDRDVIDTSFSVRISLGMSVVFKNQSHTIPVNQTLRASCQGSMCVFTDNYNAFQGFFGDVNDILVTYSSDLYLLQSRIQFHFRDCQPGEIKDNSTKKCIRCLPGRYSLSPYDTECKKCPEGTYDCVGSYLNVSVGYWRRNTTTDKAYSCGALDNKNRSRCEGGYDSHCKSGYMGSLCHQCDITQGFVRTGSETKIECSRCLKSSVPNENESNPSLLMLHLTALFYFLAFLAFEIYFITRAVKSGKQYYEAAANNRYHVRISVGPYLNLIITYFQIITIVISFEVKTFPYLYNFSSLIGEPASRIFYSLDCIFLYWGLAPENLIKTKIILLISGPIVKLMVLSIYYLIRGLNKDRKIVIIVAALSFFMFEQPQIIKKLISYVICRKFEADNEDQLSYVQGDEFFVCEGDAYYHFKHAVVVPCLIIFCLLPLALFLVLFIKKRQEKFDTEWMRRGVGVIYNGYTKQAYYWNLVVNFSKIGLIILTQVFIFEPRILVFLLVLWFYLYITLISKVKPYLEHELVNAEKVLAVRIFDHSLLLFLPDSGFTTLAGNLLYIDNSSSECDSSRLYWQAVVSNIEEVSDSKRSSKDAPKESEKCAKHHLQKPIMSHSLRH